MSNTAEVDQTQNKSIVCHMPQASLFGAPPTTMVVKSLLEELREVEKPADEPDTNQDDPGLIVHPHPLNIEAALGMKDISSHHNACVQSKKYATVGLGFVDEGDEVSNASTTEEAAEAVASLLTGEAYVRSKVDDLLDPLTMFGFVNALLDCAEDFIDTGTAYFEVTRDESNVITGVNYLPAKDVKAVTKDGTLFYQYKTTRGEVKFSRFGVANKKWLVDTFSLDASKTSEVIPIQCPSNRVRYYGYPEWLAASVDIDLLKRSKQYKADFFHNRGVMDYILAVTGDIVDTEKWSAIEAQLNGVTGPGNGWKSLALNLGGEAEVTVHKLAADNKTEDQFAKDNETFTQNIVSAHRVPPLLANILIPGKLGASNEFVNALIGFQLLVIGPYQNIFQSVLARTLGGDEGIEGLKDDDFRLRKITSQINLEGLSTIGKMRSEAATENRDLSQGVKD